MQQTRKSRPARGGNSETKIAGAIYVSDHSGAPSNLQIAKLRRLYALSVETAHTIARLAYEVAR